MHRSLGRLLRASAPVAALLVAGWLGAGCGQRAEDPEIGAAAAAREAEWRWLTQTKQVLDAQRERLAAARRARLPQGPGAPPAATLAPNRGQAAGGTATDPDVLERQIDLAAEELDRRLVDFINSDPPVAGEPLTARQREALRMRSDEDIRLAREYIEEGGDYRRALEILRAARLVDPANPRLAAEVARAEGSRYMTRARFDQAKAGMTREQVRTLLGAPNPHNVRDYPDKGIVAWFYPKGPAGAAAAIWFAKPKPAAGRIGTPAPALPAGELVVYQLDFDAVPPQGQERPPARPTPAVPRPRTAATS